MSRQLVRIILSLILLGVSTTAANAAVRYGRATGNWNVTTTWSSISCLGATGASVPAAGDDVIICPTYTVTLNANSASLNTLTIQATGVLNIGSTAARTLTVAGTLTNFGTLQYSTGQAHVINVSGAFNNNGGTFTSAAVAGAKTLTVTGLITNSGTFRYAGTAVLTVNANGGISNSSTFDVLTTSNVNHVLNVGGDISNTGTFNLAPDADSQCNATFNKNGAQFVSGIGATTRFNLITLNMGTTNANILDITATNFTTRGTGFLTLTNGTFKFSTTGTITPFTAAPAISATRGFWLNNAGATVSSGNFDWTVTGTSDTARGLVRVSSGTFNLGAAGGNNLVTGNFSDIVIGGGTVTIGGALTRAAAADNVAFNMSGGTLTVGAAGAPAANSFRIQAGSFTMSGGTIVVRRSGGGNGGYLNTPTTSSVTGGTLQIGDGSTPAANTMTINSSAPIWNFTVNNTNNPTAQLVTNNLTVKHAVTIGSGGSGTLNANNLNITVGGGATAGSGWTNNGTFTPGTGTVTFQDSTAQGITGATTFYGLAINSSSATANSDLIVNGNFTNTTGFNAGTTRTTFSGTVAQILTGITTFYDLVFNNAAGFTLNNNMTTSNALTLTSGVIATGINNVLFYDSLVSCSVTRTTGRVNGNLRKRFTASVLACDFEIGDTANYTPIKVDFTTAVTFTPGTVTAKATGGGDHPQIATAPLNAGASINRYWMLTPGGGLTFSDTTLTFTPIGGSPLVDHDNLGNVGSYTTQRYEVSSGACDPADIVNYIPGAGSWNNTDETGIQTSTSIMATNISTFGSICSHFAIATSSVSGFLHEKEFIYTREVFYY